MRGNHSAIKKSTARSTACSSCGGTPSQNNSLARYDDNGDCGNLFRVSCETQWQMRDCFKLAFCEFMTCVADTYCKEGSFSKPTEVLATGEEVDRDTGDVLLECLCEAVCTTMHCLPNAVCAPRPDECVPPPPAIDCNFAVEEKG